MGVVGPRPSSQKAPFSGCTLDAGGNGVDGDNWIMLDILVITVVGEIFKSAIVWGEVIMIYVDINLKQIT